MLLKKLKLFSQWGFFFFHVSRQMCVCVRACVYIYKSTLTSRGGLSAFRGSKHNWLMGLIDNLLRDLIGEDILTNLRLWNRTLMITIVIKKQQTYEKFSFGMYPMPWKFPSKSIILQNGGKWGHTYYFLNKEKRGFSSLIINFNSWALCEMLFKKGFVCQDINCDDQDFERTFDLYLPEWKLWWMPTLLCRLPALAEATYRDHFCRLASSSSLSQKISVTFFSGTTEASFLIFGTEHQYGELYRITHFWIVGMSTSCFTRLSILWTKANLLRDNFCHIFLGNHRSQLPDIWHRAIVWRTVSCNAFLNLRHVHFLFDATLNI